MEATTKRTFDRVVIIAPTRSTCINIQETVQNPDIPQTLLVKLKGDAIKEAVDNIELGGFGVVAGTGTGKTVGIREICKHTVGDELTVGVVTREHEATEATWRCNVLVVTPGVAVNWFKKDILSKSDLIVIDEIHQTSEHLELSMALGLRAGCEFVWMSATIDPSIYSTYLRARSVIECDAFDPDRRAEVWTVPIGDVGQYLYTILDDIVENERGVAVFVPTRDEAEGLARQFNDEDGIHAEFYHGGVSAETLRPFLRGEVPRPFIVFMTIAGASSLNIAGLDTVVIYDEHITSVVTRSGIPATARRPLGNNELLQMGGRVNGRATNGQVHILTNRYIDFHELQPTAPMFMLGGELDRVALTCARLEIDIDELDLIGEFNRDRYREILDRYIDRGIIERSEMSIRLTKYGSQVEQLPVNPKWGELLVHADLLEDDDLLDLLVVNACTEQLYSLTAREWNRSGVAVSGSDHLTVFNIVAAAIRNHGYVRGQNGSACYEFRGNWVRGRGKDRTYGEFREWCHDNGYMGKQIREITLGMQSVYRQLGRPLPEPEHFEKVSFGSPLYHKFVDLLARVQSLDFVFGGRDHRGVTIFGNRDGYSHAAATFGLIRHWTDKRGIWRANIEGTEIPEEVRAKYAMGQSPYIIGMSDDGTKVRVCYTTATLAGVRIGSVTKIVVPDEVPASLQSELPPTFARWIASMSRDTAEEMNAGMIVRNIDIAQRSRALNERAGRILFPHTDLYRWYLQQLGGARCVQDIIDLGVAENCPLPEIDEALEAEVLVFESDAAKQEVQIRNANTAVDQLRFEIRRLHQHQNWPGSVSASMRQEILSHASDRVRPSLSEMQAWLDMVRPKLTKVRTQLDRTPQVLTGEALVDARARLAASFGK
jgi:hypothetical protein